MIKIWARYESAIGTSTGHVSAHAWTRGVFFAAVSDGVERAASERAGLAVSEENSGLEK